MKKPLLLLFFLVFCITVQGQKKYTFDYMLEYKLQRSEYLKVEKVIVLVNRKDASYICYVYEKDKLNFSLVFLDNEGFGSRSTINKVDFYKSGTLNLPCNSIEYYRRDGSKKYNENLDFENIKDTLINGNYYKHYAVGFLNKKDAIMNNTGKTHFIIDNNTEYDKPLFILADVFVETQEMNKLIPNGIPKEVYTLTYKKLHNRFHKKFIYNLLHYEKIDLDMVIPIECLVAKGLQSKVKNR